MMDYFKNKEKREGLIGTIIFHAALLVVFIFFGLTYTYPPEELGVTVDLGYSDQGTGQVENQNPVVEKQEEKPQENIPTETKPIEAKEEVMTQKNEETINIPKKEEKKEEQKPVVDEKKKPTIDPKLEEIMKKAENTKASNAGSEGNKQGVGNMGQPTGDPNGNPEGGVGDGGIKYTLSGRRMTQKPTLKNDSQDQGIVVVSIVVDKYGNVTKATGGAKGSTTTSTHLTKIAEEAAYKTKFNANPDAAEEQVGTMTFIFILK